MTDSGFSGYLKVKDIIPVMESLYTEFEKSRFLDLCNKLDIPLNKSIKEFSTGMKAKLKVLCALTHKAKFLLLDEPTAALDPILTGEVLEAVTELKNLWKRLAFFITHEIDFLKRFADYFVFMDRGEVVEHGPIGLLESPETDKLATFLRRER